MNTEHSSEWQKICDTACAVRFDWGAIAKLYIEKLYS
jgi:hypothetical protein